MKRKCLFKVASTSLWFCWLCHFGIMKASSLSDIVGKEETVWEHVSEGEHVSSGVELAPCEFGHQSHPGSQWPPPCSDSLDLPPEFMPKIQTCQDIQAAFPNVLSGFFTVNLGDRYFAIVYCHMDSLCGSTGPWTRIAYLKMSNPVHECPSGLKEFNIGGVRACGRPSSTSEQHYSLYFDNSLKSYSEICGRASAHLFPEDTGKKACSSDQNKVDSKRFDGLRITIGPFHKHVWTFITGMLSESRTKTLDSNSEFCEVPKIAWFNVNQRSSSVSDYHAHSSNGQSRSCESPSVCPCALGSSNRFIGRDDYFCESAVASKAMPLGNPLWDGKDCSGEERLCCDVPGIPWFHKVLSTPTSNFIEIQLCSSGNVDQKRLLVTDFEIYIK